MNVWKILIDSHSRIQRQSRTTIVGGVVIVVVKVIVGAIIIAGVAV